MKDRTVFYLFLLVPGIIIVLIGFYMMNENVSSTGIRQSKYSIGGKETIHGGGVVVLGILFILMIPVSIMISNFQKRKNKRMLNMEAKRDMEGQARKTLKNDFYKLLDEFTEDELQKHELWEEIVTRYTESQRRYHTLKHLESLFELLNDCSWEIKNWKALCFAIYYHDIVYDPSSSTNEEDSAILAEQRMAELGIEKQLIEEVKMLILATKSHNPNGIRDAELFLDADLAILGENEERYDLYAEMIRQEFIIYADDLYNPGRIKVLEHFLAKPQIYQTERFRTRFEETARLNLKREMELLRDKQ